MTLGENSAALLEIASSEETSYSSCWYASISGLAIASPVIMSTLTRCRWTARQTSCGSNCGTNTTVSPLNRPGSVPHCALPWISGAVVSRTIPAGPAVPRRICSHSSGRRSPVVKSMPPPSVRQTSSCRQSTPFG